MDVIYKFSTASCLIWLMMMMPAQDSPTNKILARLEDA